MSLSSINYFCVSARVLLKFNEKLVRDEYTNEGYLNGEKVASPYSISIACGNCQEQPYLVGNGSLTISRKQLHPSRRGLKIRKNLGVYTLKDSPCRDCPFGGKCNFGRIYARPNHWGYKDKNAILNFQSCPRGYCCDDVYTECQRYDTCSQHRTGRLCGECEKGYSESLMSVTCVANDECDDWWIWPLGFLLAASYLLWYMYKGKLMPFTRGFIERLLSFRSNRSIVRSYENTRQTGEKSMIKQNQSQNDVDKGYFDIIVYFVNIISLLKVKVEFQSGNDGTGLLYDIERHFTRYLDVDVQQVANITVCPFDGVTAVTKNLTRPIIVLMILMIWSSLFCLNFLIHAVLQKRRPIVSIKLSNFKLTLIGGYVETMKYSYSRLAGVTFLFLSCIPMEDDFVWKFNAEIKCFSSWQMLVMAVAAIYTVPFSFTTVLGLKLLKLGQIGHCQFMIGSLCPLPFLLYWSVKYVLNTVKRAKIKAANVLKSSDQNITKSMSRLMEAKTLTNNYTPVTAEAQVILDTYQGPYRREYSSWEGIIEMRKLCFSLYYLVSNNIYRLVLCTITSTIVFYSHVRLQPFNNGNSNRAESLSLALLCIACVTNSIKTIFPESGILIQTNSPTEQLLYLLNRLDRLMILIILGYIVFSELFLIVRELKKKKKA